MTRAIFGGSHYIWQIIFLERRSIVGEAQASIFVAGAALGEVQAFRGRCSTWRSSSVTFRGACSTW